jgi:hypothetical protein
MATEKKEIKGIILSNDIIELIGDEYKYNENKRLKKALKKKKKKIKDLTYQIDNEMADYEIMENTIIDLEDDIKELAAEHLEEEEKLKNEIKKLKEEKKNEEYEVMLIRLGEYCKRIGDNEFKVFMDITEGQFDIEESSEEEEDKK